MSTQPLAPLRDTNSIIQRQYLDCSTGGASGGNRMKRTVTGSLPANTPATLIPNFAIYLKPPVCAYFKVKLLTTATDGTQSGQSTLLSYTFTQVTNGGPIAITGPTNLYFMPVLNGVGGGPSPPSAFLVAVLNASTNSITFTIANGAGSQAKAINYYLEVTSYSSVPL